MTHSVAVSTVVVLVLVTLGGCVGQAQYDKVIGENKRFAKENQDLASEVARLNLELGRLEGQLGTKDGLIDRQGRNILALQQQVAFLRGELAKAPAPRDELPADFKAALQALVDEAGGLIELEGAVVRLKSDIVFDPGKHKVKAAAQDTLQRFAAIFLQKGAGFMLRVDGHTDSDPIKASIKVYDDNWDLSYERCHAVLLILQAAGIPADQFFVTAFGEHTPRVPNDTKEGKAKNRRVEILLMSGEMFRSMSLR